MKEMPTAILPADSEYLYVPDKDEWVVQKKSGNVVLSKKEASLNPLARLEQIHSSILKQAVKQQDVVDFYLLSLLPSNYLSGDEIGTEHYDALSIFKNIIFSLREEYITRGMDELKDEAKTTQWVKAIPDEDMKEELKPYYKYHDEPYRGRHEDIDDDEETYPYFCYGCEMGLTEDEAYSFGDEVYCESCEMDAINQAIADNVLYCTTHNVFVTDDEDLKDKVGWADQQVESERAHPRGPEHQLIPYKKGVPIWDEIQANAQKQLQLQFEQRKKKREQKPEENPKNVPGEPNPPPTSMAFPEASLKQAGEGPYVGGKEDGWWEAPTNFDGLVSSDFYKLFEHAPWKHMYGGPLWAEVAKTVNEMERTTDWQRLMVLIDHFHDLGHNTGKLLDKFPEWHKWFKNLLDEKAKKNSLRYLLQRASGPVQNLVTDYLRTHGRSWIEEEEKETNFKVGDVVHDKFNDSNATILEFIPDGTIKIQLVDGTIGVRSPESLERVSSMTLNLRKFSKKDKVAYSTVKNVLIVCSGNTCRSPMAENILRSIRPDLNVVSRGLYVDKGSPMSPPAEEALKEKGIPYQPHLSKQVSASDVNTADLILVMEQWQIEEIVKLFPQAKNKTFLLAGNKEIGDPVGKSEDYKRIRDEIAQALSKMGSLGKLSKKGPFEEAICPSCGLWKPTDFTPEQLKEMDWECMECMNKRLTRPEDLPENRGQKEITTTDPEYQWLIRLVNLVTKAGVPAAEVKTLSQAYPFVTIDDAGDLAAKIWTLATEKYNIPRDWLIKKLPERKANLKNAYEGGYPTENDAVYWGTAPVNTYSDQPLINHDAPTGLREGDTGEPLVICPQCKSSDLKKEGEKATCNACGTNFIPKPDRGSDDLTVNDYSQNYFWGPNDLGRSHQNQPGANGWLPAGAEDMDGPSSNVMMSSFKSFMHKTSSLNKVAHCGPCSVLKMEALHILIDLYYKDNSLFPEEIIEELSVAATELKIDNFNDILESVITEYLEEKAEEVGDKLPKLKNLLVALKDIAPKLGKEIEVVDKQENVEREAAQDLEIGKVVDENNKSHSVLVPIDLLERYISSIDMVERSRDTKVMEQYDHDRELIHSQLVDAALKKLPKTFGTANYIEEVRSVISNFADELYWETVNKKDASLKLAKEVPTLSNKVVTDLIPMFVDKTEPPDHKCATCRFRIEKDGKNTCAIMKGEINLEKGTCNYWSEGEASKEQNPSQMERTTAGYIEADIVNCSTCKHYNKDFCSLWNGKVKDEQCCMAWEGATTKEGSLAKESVEKKYWIDPSGKEIVLAQKDSHYSWIANKTGIDVASPQIEDMSAQMLDEGWVRITPGEHYGGGVDFAIEVFDLKKIPTSVDNFIAQHFGGSRPIDISDLTNNSVQITDPFPSIQKAVNKALRTKNGSLDKQANPPSRFWIAPDGREFPVAGVHSSWLLNQGKNILPSYDIVVKDKSDVQSAYKAMQDSGWIRISNEPSGRGFQIEVQDLYNLPASLDNFIAKYFKMGDKIAIGEENGEAFEIDNPFPTIQKAVNKELRKPQITSKQATLLDEVLDQTTQDAIAAEYGPSMLIAMRFYNDAVRYGQSPDRAVAYALEEVRRMGRPIEQKNFLEVLNTYFQ